MAYKFPHRHLLGVKELKVQDITAILDLAESYISLNKKKDKKKSILKGQTLINLFFENSTRTRTSFELAGKRMGADVINMQVSSSSVQKGETLLDTAATLNAMHPDFITVRHPESGAVDLLAKKVECSVINAGDGSHEHPTQALLDALTIRKRLGRIKGLIVAICGDIMHSRVARSNITLLNTLGATVRIIAPPTLMPSHPEVLGAEVYTDMRKGVKNADIIMTLRLQQERMNGCFIPSASEYFKLYGLDKEKLALAKENALILDPGPVIRGVQIDSELADDISRSVILEQVEYGVAVRQAVLELLAARGDK